jgi:protein-tyrosine phosphatase
MIDLHSHILPGIDDGARDWDETLRMCRMAAEDGVETLAATPHIVEGLYPNETPQIAARLDELRSRLSAIDGGGSPEVILGAEVRVGANLVERLAAGAIPTLNGRSYLLLELPYDILPPGLDRLIFQLKVRGITPIIAHPERNLRIQQQPELLAPLIHSGVLVQLTAMSVTGEFGERVRACSETILRGRMAHLLASDAHNAAKRPPRLTGGVEAAAKLIGREAAEAMVSGTPRKVLEGLPVEIPSPGIEEKGRSRGWWFLGKGSKGIK